MEARKYNIDLGSKDKKELAIIEGMLKLLKVPFELIDKRKEIVKKDDESPYDPEFVKMIKERELEAKAGKFKTFDNASDAIKYLND